VARWLAGIEGLLLFLLIYAIINQKKHTNKIFQRKQDRDLLAQSIRFTTDNASKTCMKSQPRLYIPPSSFFSRIVSGEKSRFVGTQAKMKLANEQ